MNDSKWELVSSKEVFSNSRVTVHEQLVRLPNGTEVPYTVFEDLQDYPTVIPVFDDGKVLIIREHKYPANIWTHQFPEGKTEKGETVEEAAKKELLEETGYEAANLLEIGRNLHHHRRQKTLNRVFLATGLRKISNPNLEAEEQGLTTHVVSPRDIDELIVGGNFLHKSAQAAWAIYQAWQRNDNKANKI